MAPPDSPSPADPAVPRATIAQLSSPVLDLGLGLDLTRPRAARRRPGIVSSVVFAILLFGLLAATVVPMSGSIIGGWHNGRAPESAEPASRDRPAIVVRGSDLADPFLLAVGGVTYAYGTNNFEDGHVPLLRSNDLHNWERVGDALPTLPAWASPITTWAPSVTAVDGRYIMYYTAGVLAADIQCISTAVSASPAGPFVDRSPGPLICQEDAGGSIDPSPYTAAGRRYLTWKSEGIRDGQTPTLWAQPLSRDGLRLRGTPKVLLRPSLPWQHGIVEGPAMLARDGRFDLLYSAGDWHSPKYATGTAHCAGPLGPCTATAEPFLRTGADGVGPGGAEPFIDGDGQWWLGYHTWSLRAPARSPHAGRQLVLAPLSPSGPPAVPDRPSVRFGHVGPR
jgi:beta-xylosidase